MTTQIQRCRYAVIKYAHDPLRQEPVNVAVVIWSVQDPKKVMWRYDATMKRVEKLYPSANPRAVVTALAAFKEMTTANPDLLSSGIGGTGSILVTQPRGVHTADMEVEIADLYDTLVSPAEVDTEEPREKTRSSRYLKGRMNEYFKKLGVFNHVSSDERAQKMRIVECRSGVNHTFDFAYQNGVVHRIDTLSFDHGTNHDRIVRARSFANLVDDVTNAPGADKKTEIVAVVQAPTESIQADVYGQVRKILHTVKLNIIEVHNDKDLMGFCEQTKSQLHP